MNIVFLDIDGVLNSGEFMEKTRDVWKTGTENNFDPEAMKHLNLLLDLSGAKVVISSTWRLLHSIGTLSRMLGFRGFAYRNRVIGQTPKSQTGYRGTEIDAWLQEWKGDPVGEFVILDDGSDMSPWMHRLVQTDFMKGLQRSDVAKALEVLKVT